MSGWKRVRIVETARRDVDRVGRVVDDVGERGTAGAAERASHGRGRNELGRIAGSEGELLAREGEPGHHWRTGDTAAGLAMAHHGVARHAARAITHGTAETASFDHLHRTLARPISTDVVSRHLPRTVRLFHRRD